VLRNYPNRVLAEGDLPKCECDLAGPYIRSFASLHEFAGQMLSGPCCAAEATD
jgi:hypothetical protein